MTEILIDPAELGQIAAQLQATSAEIADLAATLDSVCCCEIPATVSGLIYSDIGSVASSVGEAAGGYALAAADLTSRVDVIVGDQSMVSTVDAVYGVPGPLTEVSASPDTSFFAATPDPPVTILNVAPVDVADGGFSAGILGGGGAGVAFPVDVADGGFGAGMLGGGGAGVAFPVDVADGGFGAGMLGGGGAGVAFPVDVTDGGFGAGILGGGGGGYSAGTDAPFFDAGIVGGSWAPDFPTNPFAGTAILGSHVNASSPLGTSPLGTDALFSDGGASALLDPVGVSRNPDGSFYAGGFTADTVSGLPPDVRDGTPFD